MATCLQVSTVARPGPALVQRAAAQCSLPVARPLASVGRRSDALSRGRSGIPAKARSTDKADEVAQDFDSFLAKLADKFEGASNKPAIVGYSAAALGFFFFVEWLIHLPGLSLILGFPLEAASVLLLPYFGVKYLIDKDDVKDDIGNAVNRVTKELPGLGK